MKQFDTAQRDFLLSRNSFLFGHQETCLQINSMPVSTHIGHTTLQSTCRNLLSSKSAGSHVWYQYSPEHVSFIVMMTITPLVLLSGFSLFFSLLLQWWYYFSYCLIPSSLLFLGCYCYNFIIPVISYLHLLLLLVLPFLLLLSLS